jgi:glycosyltransferase involved in cell wall biosynthesis
MLDYLRPGVAARRVMRRLHLGDAWSRIALCIDRRRPTVSADDWSQPLVPVRLGAMKTANVLTTSDAPSGRDACELGRGARTKEQPTLRCLLATPTLDVGGMEEVVAFLARRLPSFGVHTAVLCGSAGRSASGQLTGRIARALESDGIEVRALGTGDALEWIRSWQPDVISVHGDPLWAPEAAKRAGVPFVDNLHSMNGVIGRDWRWHSAAARDGELAAVVAVSDVLRRQHLAVNPGFPPERIITIPNGVDERRAHGNRAATRNRLGITDEYLLVSLGRYCMQKNAYGLITAFSDVSRIRPDAHLVIAGNVDESPYYRRVHKLRAATPYRGRIHLRDHYDAPWDLLAAADGFVLPSFFEGWPLASMEALCAGLPVVMTEVSGAREQIGNDRSRGYVVAHPLGDPLADWSACAAARYRPHANREELAAAIDRLISDRDDYQRNRQQLAAESGARFSSTRWAEQHAKVLRAAAAASLPATAEAL